MIKRFILAAVIAVSSVGGATVAYAQCYTETYFFNGMNGKMTVCTICVTGNHRTVNCF
jgi:hypothetical protein